MWPKTEVSVISDAIEIAVVIPAYQAGAHLRTSLAELENCSGDAPVLVVDAGSTDDTGELARSMGARVLRLPERQGPAAARNSGARELQAEVLLFLDADCAPHRDVVQRVRDAFAEAPDLVALTGSYDATPPERNFASLYMNLRHHFTHQRARREPGTFWAGCGAVRREPFLRAGGFDAERYPRPQIEDIELATRLRPLGRLRLDPDLQVKHLKRWSLRSVIETDIRSRAVPWASLLGELGELPDDLNMRRSQRVAATIAPLALCASAALPWAAFSGHGWIAALSCALLLAALGLNWPLVACFARNAGPAFAAGGFLFHQLHLTYSSVVFATVMALRRFSPARRPKPADPRGRDAAASSRPRR